MEQEVNLWLTRAGDWCFLKNKGSGAGSREDHRMRGEVHTMPCGKSFVSLETGENKSQDDVLVRLLTGLA